MANNCQLRCLYLISCLFISFSTSCKTTSDSSIKASQDVRTSENEDLQDAKHFRDIFFGLIKDKYSADDLYKLVYLPSPELVAIQPEGSDPEQALRELGAKMKAFRPSQLYNYGKSVPAHPVSDPDAAFRNRRGPVTIVIIPGIFGEFIDAYPFYEMINGSKSSLSRRFQKALSETSNAALKTTSSFDFGTLKDKDIPLAELVKVASYDDASGTPLFNLVALPSRPFSAETLGTLANSTDAYLERLEKYFALMGVEPNTYILGYSRGAPVALDLAVQADKRKVSWSSGLKGVISLGGVNYGTALADAAYDPKTPESNLVARIEKLSRDLDDGSIDASAAARVRNSKIWSDAARESLAIALATPIAPGLVMENIKVENLNIEMSVQKLYSIAFKDFDFSSPDLPNYFMNVKKFKFIIGKVIEGIITLRTDSRIAWWQNNIIPPHMKLFAVAGAMGDPSDTEHGIWELTGNPLAYNRTSADYRLLRGNYYELYEASGGISVSDSQVSVERSRFQWPLNKIINPAQPKFETYYMGIMGTDHWGFSFPMGFPSTEKAINPFPRTDFIHALAAFVSEKSD